MPETLLDSITRLLRYRRVPEQSTKAFRHWKHNADILPRVQTQLEMVLEAYGKFQPLVYDTQGVNDDGSDVVLRCRAQKSDRDPDLICFQVKSFHDLAKQDYLRELKAQRDDSFRKVAGLQYYFLLLCTEIPAHTNKVRSIAAEFRSADRTEVIEPAFAFTFLHHPKTRVEALVKRTMEADDLVLRIALESLDLTSPSARALAVFLTVRAVLTGDRCFSIGTLVAEPALRSIYEQLRNDQAMLLEQTSTGLGDDNEITDVPVQNDYEGSESGEDDDGWQDDDYEWDEDDEEQPVQLAEFEVQLAEDIEAMEEAGIEIDTSSQALLLQSDQFRALYAVACDALARYDYDEQHLMAYMFSLMGVRD